MENTIKKRWTRETTERFLENLYLAVFSVFIAWSFLATTKFEIIWWEDFYQDIRIVLFLVVIARIAYMRNFERKEILFIGILGVIFCLTGTEPDI